MLLRFSVAASLKRHLQRHSGIRPHVCSKCGKSFVRSDELTAHERLHSNRNRFPCPVCGKGWDDWSMELFLIDHLLLMMMVGLTWARLLFVINDDDDYYFNKDQLLMMISLRRRWFTYFIDYCKNLETLQYSRIHVIRYCFNFLASNF